MPGMHLDAPLILGDVADLTQVSLRTVRPAPHTGP